jgi:hypothetical protein
MKTVEKPVESNHVRVTEKPVPAYRKHKQSGQAIVTLTNGLRSRRDVLLGKFGTKASRQEYARVIAEWESSGRQLPARCKQTGEMWQRQTAFGEFLGKQQELQRFTNNGVWYRGIDLRCDFEVEEA